MTLPIAYVQMVLLVAVRIGALLMVAPIFGARTIPAPVKISLALILTVALFPPGTALIALPSDIMQMIFLVMREVFIGVFAGFALHLVFVAVQMAASLVGVQMGFGIGGVFDPTLQQVSTPLDQFYNMLAVLIFLATDLHHQVFIGVARLFTALPVGEWSVNAAGSAGLVTLFGQVLVSAMEMALPLLATMLLADMALGLAARFIPQMNVFFVGMPMKAAIGLLAFMAALPFLVQRIQSVLAAGPQGFRLLVP